jgi:S1-C subfamily serine protease
MKSMRIACVLGWVVTAGCFVQTIEPEIDPTAPVVLKGSGNIVIGSKREDVLVIAASTIPAKTLNTNLIRDVAAETQDAIVSIYTKTKTPVRRRLLPLNLPFGGIKVNLPGQALGSGFFIHESGLVITNAHVIRDAERIRCLTADGADYEMTVLAFDPVYDLALLKVQDTNRTFQPLPMGNSDEVRPGDMVIAVGNPLGLGHTVTAGIISQTGRHLSGVEQEGGRRIDYIQTDTAINPGSSGGPLITLAGAWVGVNTAGIVEAQNIGFSVPSTQVQEFIDNVLAGRGERE